MTRVLFASHDALIGGAQNVLHALVLELRERGITPLMLFPSEGPGVERSRQAGLEVRISKMEWWTPVGRQGEMEPLGRFVEGLEQRVEAIVELIEATSVDVVFANTAVILEPALAAHLAGRPHIWHVLEMLGQNRELCSSQIAWLVKGIMAGTSNRVVAVSEAVRADLSNRVPDNLLQVIRTGIDPRPFAGPHAPSARFRLLYLGPISDGKGMPELMIAMAKVLEVRPEVELRLAGPVSPERCAELLQGIPETHRGRVRFLGFRRDVPDLLRSADALVLPSRADSLPVSVLEAMAAGLPVIGTYSGGMAEEIVDGLTGRLVPKEDADKLAAAILDVVSNPIRARAMGEAGRQRVKAEFSHEKMVSKFAEVIEQARKEGPVAISDAARAHLQEYLQVATVFGAQLNEQVLALSQLEQLHRETALERDYVRAQRDALDAELTVCRQERERYRVGLEALMNQPYVRAGRAVKNVLRRLTGRGNQGV